MTPALPDSELAKLQYTLDAARAATWDIDLVDNTVRWSDNAETVLGLRPGTLSKTFEPEPEWIHPVDRQRTLTALWEAARGGNQYVVEHRIVDAEGRARWVAARGGVVRDKDDTPVRVVGVVVDITERHLLAQRLEAELAAKDRFLTAMGHELRTPLTAILGFASELHSGTTDTTPGSVQDVAGIISQQAEDMVAIIDDLLVAGRDPQSPVPIDPHQLDLCTAAARVIETWPADQRDRITIDDGPVRAHADPIRLRQILRNLLTNAVRHGGPTITVRCWETAAENRSHIVVMDDGPGVPEESANAAAEDTVGSIGIGLLVSQRLAERMGGSLTYERVDETTRFELQLPMEG